MCRHLIALLAALTIGIGTASAQDAADCEDFASQAAAQAAYRADPSDPAGNDADGDGLACELFAFADPATDTTPVTAGEQGGRTATPAAGGVVQIPRTGVGPATGAQSWPVAVGSAAALAAVGFGYLSLRGLRRA